MADTVVPSANTILEVLNLNNYEDWSFRVETYLCAKGLWEVVKATAETPYQGDSTGETEYKDWSKKNAKALYAIQNSCGTDAFAFIRDIRTAKDAWDTLAKKLKPVRASKNTDEGFDGLQLKDLEINAVVEVEVEAYEQRNIYKPFFKYLENRHESEWSRNQALEFLRQHPKTVTETHPSSRMPALHLALLNAKADVAKKLVQLMTVEDLEILDPSGRTALCLDLIGGYLSAREKTAIAKCMVEKNERLLSIVDPTTNMIPLVMAHSIDSQRLEKVARYLYAVTSFRTVNVRQAAELISVCLKKRKFDIPMHLIQLYPVLGFTKDLSGKSPLYRLADMCDIFLSGRELTFWQQWIYNCIDFEELRNAEGTREHLTSSDMSLFRRQVRNLYKFFGGGWIQNKIIIHSQVLTLLNCICEKIRNKSVAEMQESSLLRATIFRAVEKGQVEFITHIFRENRNIEGITNEKDRTVLQFAADCRQEKIYNLTYGFTYTDRDNIYRRRDKFDNNMLHIVGSFSSHAQATIDHIRGAALQMQREAQWFSEVVCYAPWECLDVINHTDRLQPVEVFAKYHKDLMKEGEKSMKETATSCTVVGALIVTMMFAAAFTIPGGNNGETGFPIFSNEKAFMIFIVFDAISLFSSTTSVMIFLGILTSRYKMNDFIKSLPSKMIAGLFTLFLSVATMMIAFSTALFITLNGKLWIVIPVIFLSSVPIASFVWMQFPFFIEIFISTYGANIFVKDFRRF